MLSGVRVVLSHKLKAAVFSSKQSADGCHEQISKIEFSALVRSLS